ncbi:serine/threonine-protein phosphatase 6 regulatory ankyrin repeat subunit A-like [Haliotis asinina]|uniref:serine/threonine-protein phosphatase 6 regulatory ankyrin repeat subunit A-like n=1 Tax=Haliotis asinina TaxID=109174 RepID=UPI0035319025
MSKGQVDIDSREGEYGRTPVMLAARGGHRILFEFLREKGCNMSLLDNKENNILHMACYSGQIAIVKFVLSLHIVDINSREHYGRTCVMIAAHRGKMDVLKYLLKRGGDVSLLDKTGENILHIACRGGHVEMVKYIISRDYVDINSKGRDGRTVGMIAAQFGYRNIFDLCACAGCNLLAVDAKGNNILHVAILGGHARMVKHVLPRRLAKINSRGMNGKTPLMFAAFKGHKDVFDSILDEGGVPSLVDKNGDNILHWACRGGHVEMVKYIISQNFTDINSRGQKGMTPIMVAAAYGYRRVFDLVMSKGGDALLLDTDDDNILHWACRGGHVEMVKYIISQNFTDINSRGQKGMTPIMVAAAYGYRRVFDLVMSKGGDALLLDTDDDNILHWACRGGHVEMVKYIISKNITDINSRGRDGKTPIMAAAVKGYRQVFDLVMSKGGGALLVDTNGENVLHWACRGGHVEMVKYIISQNFTDINSRGHYGRTPIMVAAVKGYRGVFDLVMSKGGDPSGVDRNGDNILHWVCTGGHVEMVKYVLSLNFTDINSKGKNGKTPIMVAAIMGHKQVFDLVMSKGGGASRVDTKGDNILHWACRGGHAEMVKYIISQNFTDINSRGHYGRTPIMVAAVKGHRGVFDLVMSKGGDPSGVDRNGDNILHWVCTGGHVEMVKYVLSLNFTDINSKGKNGKTPIMVAAIMGHKQVFDLVMSKGGDASRVDRKGDNILHWACRGGHAEMLKYIISQNFTDINSRGHYGRTPIMVAAVQGYRGVFDLVMSNGGNASLVDTNGDNILHLASWQGHVLMVKHILSKTVIDVNAKDKRGYTAKMLVKKGKRKKMYDLLTLLG